MVSMSVKMQSSSAKYHLKKKESWHDVLQVYLVFEAQGDCAVGWSLCWDPI